MSVRITRAAAAKAAAALTSETESQLPSLSPTLSPTKKVTPPKRLRASKNTIGASLQGSLEIPSKRKRQEPTKIEDSEYMELPHNMGRVKRVPTRDSDNELSRKLETVSVKTKVKSVPQDKKSIKLEDDSRDVASHIAESSSPKKRRKGKANKYGLTPGETPYPDWPHPTPEECQQVNDLLAEIHGKVEAPKTIPMPSLTVSGCGEVPSILDALIRTLLSAATTGTNSARAFQGLVDKFGILQDGIGKGSVDWNAVRQADVKDVFQAIKSGGLADTKSKRIKEILDMVYKENKAKRYAFLKARKDDEADGLERAENETKRGKQAEITRVDEHVLSLDHLHALSSDDALNTLIKYPGIGPKTASCVLLFCMQRPSFAVDTHVFRLCKWLKWVPPDKATRNSTYSHCEVRIPDHLKYPLHQLLIKHGKTCPRCRAATRENSDRWEEGCPIDHLVERSGKRKSGKDNGKGKKVKRGGNDTDTDDSGLTDIDENIEFDQDTEDVMD
ncbi:MAG: hypothetical protein M1834_007415 [Cirrosporium novae-zelandiae]|nr:MAG: hypothetical protein M1834_007415 [Cirrosporium novae-zelandiae]